MPSTRCIFWTLSLATFTFLIIASLSRWPELRKSTSVALQSDQQKLASSAARLYTGSDPFEYPDYCNSYKTVALTFDDGPDDEIDDLLALLNRYNATVSFFENGPHHFGGLRDLPGKVKKILEHGHHIGNHGWNHINMSNALPEILDFNLNKMNDWLAENFQIRTQWVRPPWGLCDDLCLRHLHESRYIPVGYAVDVEDWRYNTANLVDLSINEFHKWTYQWERTRSSRRRGPIVSLHAGYRPVVDTTAPAILQYFHERGFRFVSVAECLSYRREEWYV
ncbi:Polysaccharide deacetylase-like protein 3 [Elsinoe fawcettii]|nr:Polysaccharide deacetylase-like protein 3 [Elsinoe fawcettii]